MLGKLFVLATPIGNLGDISLRALETLKSADAVLAEDTRVVKKILNHYEIHKQILSYHEHSGRVVYLKIAALLQAGKNLVLATDAGTPNISDPGFKLLRFLTEHFGGELVIIPIPGASAVSAIVSVADFPVTPFCFLGYPPAKKGRNRFFKRLSERDCAVVFFESPHRIKKTFLELDKLIAGEMKVVVGRELTKKFETIMRGGFKEVARRIESEKSLGEYVILIEGKR